MAIIYGLKVNLSVAMVAMLNHTELNKGHSHPVEHALNVTKLLNATIAAASGDDSCVSAAESSATIEVISSRIIDK